MSVPVGRIACGAGAPPGAVRWYRREQGTRRHRELEVEEVADKRGRLAHLGRAGRFPTEELRKAGQDESLISGMAVVWQPFVGPAAVVDTLIIAEGAPIPVTPPDEWPVPRITLRGGPPHDIPDVFVSE